MRKAAAFALVQIAQQDVGSADAACGGVVQQFVQVAGHAIAVVEDGEVIHEGGVAADTGGLAVVANRLLIPVTRLSSATGGQRQLRLAMRDIGRGWLDFLDIDGCDGDEEGEQEGHGSGFAVRYKKAPAGGALLVSGYFRSSRKTTPICVLPPSGRRT